MQDIIAMIENVRDLPDPMSGELMPTAVLGRIIWAGLYLHAGRRR